MIGRWARFLLWRPFEISCRRFPLVPLRAQVSEPVSGVRVIKIENFVTRAITAIGGGYDYSVCYLLDDELMIDTGYAWAARSLLGTIRELGVERRLKWIVNTHAHEDHTGNNDVLVEATGATVYAHPSAISQIRHPTNLPWYRHFMFGPPSAVNVEPLPSELHTESFVLETYSMPGHTDSHVCLFERTRRWLFSGDLFVSASLDSQLREVDGPAWIVSLERALDLEPEVLFDGHGRVVSGRAEVRELLCAKRDFLREIADRVATAAAEAKSVRQITREVFRDGTWTDRASFSEGWLSILTASDFSRSHLVQSFLAPGATKNVAR